MAMQGMVLRQVLNQIINVFWTLICFLPVVLYWLSAERTLLIPFVVLSCLGIFISSRFYQLSRNRRFYQRLGVRWVRLFVQDGILVSRFQQRKAHGRIIRNRRQAKNYLRTIVMYERFHFLCFLFYTFTAIHAFAYKELAMGLLITGCNIFYNVYPIFLQQFNRIRVERF